MAKKSDVGRLFDEAKKAFGRLDVLINNAGIYEFAPLDTISEENFHKQFDINVLGLIFASQEAAKYFGAEGGSIVNISSITSTLTPPNSAVYSGTKAAVDATTKVLAKELGPKKIRVNAVNPGMVDTEGWRAAGLAESELRKFVESQTPLGRIGKPDDIAPAVAFFASPDSSWITGETLTIAGGFR
jgi:3-oxoacyl-[acyl-carrier protein] reductase